MYYVHSFYMISYDIVAHGNEYHLKGIFCCVLLEDNYGVVDIFSFKTLHLRMKTLCKCLCK